MGDVISTITDVFSNFGTGLFNFLKSGFSNLIWQDPEATTKVLSDFAKWGLTFMGISLVLGITYAVIRKIG